MTPDNNWLESARRLMSELSQQPFETQQSMQELSRKSYPSQTSMTERLDRAWDSFQGK